MPLGSVRLIPGVNVERTPTLLEAGISASKLIRFRDSLVEKFGGWAKFYANSVAGTPRDLHAWQDLNQVNHLASGSTTQLGVITAGVLTDITPQTLTSDFAPSTNISTTINTPTVGITDANISNVTVLDAVYFNTPVYIGGLVLSGLYQIASITGTHAYTITAASNATASATNASPPIFTTTSGSATVSVQINAHGVVVAVGPTGTVVFPIATTGNGVTIKGAYVVTGVTDANNFTIVVGNQASASGAFTMNGGSVELLYYLNLGPPAIGTGFGLGGFGSGGFGTGVVPTSQTGTPITATDWTSDNWGEILLECPANGGVYQYDPTGGFTNAALIATSPLFNAGMFVSTRLQILVCWGSTVTQAIGVLQDPMFVKWSTVGDFTVFTPLTTNQAGGFRIPIGSKIMGGIAVANQNFIWTDLDLWVMNYLGPPDVFGFNKIGAGAGLVSSHAAQQLRGAVYWMGRTNFYVADSQGVRVLPCPVWDAVFQNLNTAQLAKIRAMPNTPFNEAGWLYPSAASTGENDSYVKFNITEPGAPWDYGPLPRSAWIDQTVLGNPIGASPTGIIYQHETTPDADGAPLNASFTTGYFEIAEGEQFFFIDQFYPDMKFGTFGKTGAQMQISFNVVNFPDDAPTTYGPYTYTAATEYIGVGFRGRQMSLTYQSNDVGSFWRIGRPRYRYAPDGRA